MLVEISGSSRSFSMASCLLTVLMFWPYTFAQLAVVWEPEVVTDVGRVQKVYFQFYIISAIIMILKADGESHGASIYWG
jgi:hypothetical protein